MSNCKNNRNLTNQLCRIDTQKTVSNKTEPESCQFFDHTASEPNTSDQSVPLTGLLLGVNFFITRWRQTSLGEMEKTMGKIKSRTKETQKRILFRSQKEIEAGRKLVLSVAFVN